MSTTPLKPSVDSSTILAAVKESLGAFNQQATDKSDGPIHEGAKLLATSALQVCDNLTHETRPQVILAWRSLVDEVLAEFQRESTMVAHRLSLKEYRPRTSFAILPHTTEWITVHHDASINVERYRLAPIGPLPPPRGRRLTVLLPITNGYRRTYRALVGICHDLGQAFLAKYNVDFHVCVNYSDDNSLYEVSRFASTVGCARGVNVMLYHAEDPAVAGPAGRHGHWKKTTVLNVMLQSIFGNSAEWGCAPDRHILHFADDDIRFQRVDHAHAATGVIESHINSLEQSLVQVLSACCFSYEDLGFSALSSVRKHKEYVAKTKVICNLYGASMTTTAKRLAYLLYQPKQSLVPQFPQPALPAVLAEDCFLTILANLDVLCSGSDPGDLAAYADGRTLIGHPEATNVVSYAQRFARDLAWGEQAIQICAELRPECGDLAHRFEAARRESFRPVGEAINEGSDPRHLVAQAWLSCIRTQVKRDRSVWALSARNWGWVNWAEHKTQHQICSDIVEDDAVFASILDVMAASESGELRNFSQFVGSSVHRHQSFPHLSNLLAHIGRNALSPVLHQNAYLFHWYYIALEAQEYCDMFERATEACNGAHVPTYDASFTFDLRGLMERAGLSKSQASWTMARAGEASYGYGAFICAGEKKEVRYYLHYCPVVGFGTFLSNSPRRLVYLQVLGETLVKLIMNRAQHLTRQETSEVPALPLCLPETLYPLLENAVLGYAGPERRAPFDRFLQSLYIQTALPEDVVALSVCDLSQRTAKAVAGALATFLGWLHGSTLGIRKLLEHCYVYRFEYDPWVARYTHRGQVVSLLVEHLDQWRLFGSPDYARWLRGGGDASQSVKETLAGSAHRSTVVAEVVALIRQNRVTLDELWEGVVDESVMFHERFGAVGHLGLDEKNIFVGARKDQAGESLHVPNHSFVGMVDPAIEAGQVLAEIVSKRYRVLAAEEATGEGEAPALDEMENDKSLFQIVLVFLAKYQDELCQHLDPALTQQPTRGSVLDRETDVPRLLTRLSRMAAFSLLVKHGADEVGRQGSDAWKDVRKRAAGIQLSHTCLDLLQVGTILRLQFRAPRRSPL